MKPLFMRNAKSSKKAAGAKAAYMGLEKLPTYALVSTINTMIEILKKRGVPVTDWDDRTKDVCGMQFFGNTAYILAPSNRGGRHSVEGFEEEDQETPDASL